MENRPRLVVRSTGRKHEERLRGNRGAGRERRAHIQAVQAQIGTVKAGIQERAILGWARHAETIIRAIGSPAWLTFREADGSTSYLVNRLIGALHILQPRTKFDATAGQGQTERAMIRKRMHGLNVKTSQAAAFWIKRQTSIPVAVDVDRLSSLLAHAWQARVSLGKR